MTKQRHISLRDYVTYGGHEWIVVGKGVKKVKLVRRQVCTGSAITVRKKKVKLADQSWRCRMLKGDALKVFIMGKWVHASVYRSNGKSVDVQPSFCNHIITLPVHSSRIVQDTHDFPLWSASKSSVVIADGLPRLSRGSGLIYPWNYTTYIEVQPPPMKHVIDYTFDVFPVLSHPLSMYNCLTTQEIIYDLFTSKPNMPRTLDLLVNQYVESRFKIFPVASDNTVEQYINFALEKNDNVRVQELLSIGQHTDLFNHIEWVMQNRWNKPVFDLAFEFKDKKLHVKVFWTGLVASNAALKTVYSELSLPVSYNPPQYIGLNTSSDIRKTLSHMLGMEEEPIQKLYKRKMGNVILMPHKGINTLHPNRFGGVVCVYGLRVQKLLKELMLRSPLKTVVIVNASSIAQWKDCKHFHGRRKEDGALVVTTKNTFMRHYTYFDAFERIVCVCIPSFSSMYHHTLRAAKAKTRWAICDPDHIEDAWNVHSMPRDERAEIYLTRDAQIREGVIFPTVNIRFHQCKTPCATNVLQNTAMLPLQKRIDIVCKFLLHPSLVAEHYGGERLDMYEGTVKTIAEKLKIKQALIEEHLTDKCAVCLCSFDTPTVTSCGHVYCADCTKELQTRGINCPMCRKKVEGYMRVSKKDTEGKVIMHNGDCYRISEPPQWGAKMEFLRKHPEATIISRFSSVLQKLRKELPNKDMYTLKAHEGGRFPLHSSVILLEPCRETPNFETPFGQDIDLTILSYPVDL